MSYDPDGTEVLLADVGGRRLEALLGHTDVDQVDCLRLQRATKEHKILDVACERFLREVMSAMQKDQPSLSTHELDIAVRSIAAQEASAWQIQKHRSSVYPLTARIVWQVSSDDGLHFAR